MKMSSAWNVGPEFNFDYAIENLICGQRRTSNAKQFVFFDGDYVWKGPFKKEKIFKLQKRYDRILQWKLPLVVLPRRRIYPITSEIYLGLTGYFLRFDNLAKDYPLEYEDHKESFSDFEYKIIKRHTLLKISDLLKKKDNDWIYQYVPQMSIALLGFFLLGIGDLHTCNILADIEKKTIHIIDFDQDRSVDPEGDFFFLSKPPAKAIAEKWKEILIENKKEIIERIKEIPVDTNELIEKINNIRNSSEARGESAGGISQKGKNNIAFVKNNFKGGLSQEGENNFAFIGEESPQEKDSQNPQENGGIGKMKSGGRFGGITFSGLKTDICKSGLQKYIRRGEIDEALMMAYELYRMNEIGDKAIVTNFYNRLCVISAEDIGPSNIPLVEKVLSFCINRETNFYSLIPEMCNSSKTRILSHLARVYNIKGKTNSEKHGILIEISPQESPFPLFSLWKENDPQEIRVFANNFYLCLQEKNNNAFTWGQRYYEDFSSMKVVARNRRTKACVILWRMMDLLIPKDVKNLFSLLEKCFFDLSEDKPFLRMAIYLVLDQDYSIGNKTDFIPKILEKDLQIGKYEIIVKDYVIDQHTAEGRKNGSTRNEFVNEGAFVTNEDPRFDNEILKKIYVE